MKFGRSRLQAMLQWLSLSFKFGGRLSKPASLSAPSTRRGPWLADWRQLSWTPVYDSVHPTAQRLILAALRNEMLSLRYWGGSTPGRERYISPAVVFQLRGRGPLYVAGYCHLRRAERVFRVDRVEISSEEDLIICITE
ncbi:MAG TPA: WYL domain-containing protein [Verrucomicrobiae bacterium]|nr:WYL domain-containing protein [Verrucomicrobiae bacterium]